MGFISGEIGPGAFSEEKKWAGSSNTILHHSTIIAATIWREECERKENEVEGKWGNYHGGQFAHPFILRHKCSTHRLTNPTFLTLYWLSQRLWLYNDQLLILIVHHAF